MDPRQTEGYDPAAALADIERADRRVRAGTRWHVWYMVAYSAVIYVFYAVVFVYGIDAARNGPLLTWGLPAGLLIFAGVLWLYARRQGAVRRDWERFFTKLMVPYFALAVVAIVAAALMPDSARWVGLLLAVLPALPGCYGAWRVYRS